MSDPSPIQLAVPTPLLGDIDRLAGRPGVARDDLILTAINRFVADEDEAGELGVDDRDAGRWLTKEEVVRRVSERRRRAA